MRPTPQKDDPATSAKPPCDWERVESWTRHIAVGDFAAVDAVFITHTGHAPTIVWEPAAETITAGQLRFLLQYWSSLMAGGRLPQQRQIDPLAMRPALGYVMLIDVVDGGHDFRYRLYGSTIAQISQLDMTGRLMSEHPASTYVNEFGLAANRAIVRRRLPLYTERTPALAERTTRWQRLALPFTDDTGAVTRLLVGTVPVARDGSVLFS